MRILLDSSYLFPLIGISVKNIDRKALLKLLEDYDRLFVSVISLFELSAKGAKLVNQEKLTPDDVTQGIQSIYQDPRFIKFPYHSTQIQHTAFMLRKTFSDYIDCLIMSTAIIEADILLTEDKIIHGQKQERDIQALIQVTNPDFKILKLNELSLSKR